MAVEIAPIVSVSAPNSAQNLDVLKMSNLPYSIAQTIAPIVSNICSVVPYTLTSKSNTSE